MPSGEWRRGGEEGGTDASERSQCQGSAVWETAGVEFNWVTAIANYWRANGSVSFT